MIIGKSKATWEAEVLLFTSDKQSNDDVGN